MFVKAHKSQGKNSGSCTSLAEYLEKESQEGDKEDTKFFSNDGDSFEKDDVIMAIDHNNKGIAKNEDKFYMLTINPSHNELEHLIGRSGTSNYDELSSGERETLNEKLQEYTREVMHVYAKNFERDKVKSGDALVYFARIETERYYRHYDRDVADGLARPGDKKPGLNVHVHVIVSRNSKDQSTKLSPHAKSRGNTWKLQGKNVKRGFDHERFKVRSQEKFNDMYQYKPKYNETYQSKDPQRQSIFNAESRIKGQIKHVLTKDVKQSFREERKVLQTAVKLVAAIKNPVPVTLSEVKKQISNILTGEKVK